MRSHGRKMLRRLPRAGALLALVLGVTVMGIALAAAAPNVPAPTIVNHPADPTSQTSASFTYSDTQPGVTYQCQLDAAGYTPCPSSGVSYAGPLAQGNHTFKVQALAAGKTSTATSFTWLVDLTTPTATLSFPAEGG